MFQDEQARDQDTQIGWLKNRLRNEATILTSPTAKMDFLREQLSKGGRATDGMSLKLLWLEWRYDVLILAGGLTRWMRKLDTRFNHFPQRQRH